MAYTKTNRQPRGYEVQLTRLREIDDGVSPALEVFPAYTLPVVLEDKVHDLWKVILAGQIVAIDATSLNSGAVDNTKWLVPANGLNATTLTYTADDIGLTADIDQYNTGAQTAVTVAGAASKQVAANFPVGVATYDYYSKCHSLASHATDPQPNVTFKTDYHYEIPLIYQSTDGASGVAAEQEQNTLAGGRLVKAGSLGWPVLWVSASDSVEQICGRCLQIIEIDTTKDMLDKVHTVPGLGLPGTGTSGRGVNESFYLLGTTTYVVHKARINITLA